MDCDYDGMDEDTRNDILSDIFFGIIVNLDCDGYSWCVTECTRMYARTADDEEMKKIQQLLMDNLGGNEESGNLKALNEAHPGSSKRLRFWRAVSSGLEDRIKLQTPKNRAYFEVSLGRTGFFLSNILYHSGEMAVRFLLAGKGKDDLYQRLLTGRKKIERHLGAALIWSDPGDSKLIISLSGPSSDLEEEEDFVSAVAWMVEWIAKFYEVFEPLVKNF